MDGAMTEMLQMWMQFESSSTGGVLLYAVGPEGSKGAAEGVFSSWGRPTERDSRSSSQNGTK
jgi:hypothetical protein